MPAPLRLLVVCLGNICRSPMAEGLLRRRLEEAGLGAAVELDSAGLGAWTAGEPPDPRAIACAAGHGVDIAGLRARPVRAADFDRFDWVLCADDSNRCALDARAPAGARARTALLLDWAGQGSTSIPDPYSGDARAFEDVWRMLDGASAGVVDRVRAELRR